MQASQISPTATPPAQPSKSATAAGPEGGLEFGQVLTREVAERSGTQSAEGRNASQETPSSPGAQKEETTPAAEVQPDEQTNDAGTTPGTDAARDAAASASAEMLALVASIAHFQGGAAATGTEEAPVEPGASGKPGRNTPFGALHATLGAQQDAATARAGKPEATLPLPATIDGSDARNNSAAAAQATGSNDFSAALKDVSQLLQPMQQSAPAQAAPAPGLDRIPARVGSSGWDEALGQKIVWMVNGEQQSASLELNPPELGPLKVVLQVSNAQANATFVAAQPEVRQALEAAMPKLRDMLGEAGIQLGQASVDSGAQQQHSAQRGSENGTRRSAGDGTDASAPAVTVTRVRPSATGTGMVDTFA